MKRWIPLIIIIIALILIMSTGLHQYLSFETLKNNRDTLLTWTNAHLTYAILIYILTYIAVTILSIPGATILTLAGGFLFGPILGSILVVCGATIGATGIYLAIKTSLGDWVAARARGWVSQMRKGFHDNAFSYLLFLRLVPLFPFWVVNIVPALLGVNAYTFILATFLGIIPGTVIYVWVGHGLGHVFESDQTPSLDIIFEPVILYPLLALALLSLVPILVKRFSKR